ncbi:MAG: hypothetical protein RSD22_06450 [Romboutsia sp.]
MKKFKGMKKLEQLIKDAEKQGWVVDLTEFDKGSDWFWLRDMDDRVMQVAVNCFGRFMVYTPQSDKPIATEKSEEFDNEDWYCELLDLINEPLD